MLRLYDFLTSGNCWKIRLVFSHLGIPYERIEIDRFADYAGSPAYRAVNPLGLVPALRLEDGRILHDSGAIAFFLAEGTPLLPDDGFGRGQVIQWLIFEQRYLCETVGLARYFVTILGEAEQRAAELAEAQRLGYEALDQLERHLAGRAFLVGEGLTIADLCNYVYVGMAHQGAMDTTPYPAVRAWVERLEVLPRHVALREAPEPVERLP